MVTRSSGARRRGFLTTPAKYVTCTFIIEQARYYEMAKREKLIHKQLFPGWTARDNYAVMVRHDSVSTNQHLEILIIRLTLTQLLCPVTLTFDPLILKLVHGVLVSRGSFLPSLVFVGLFVFSLGGGTGQTDRQTDRRTASIHNGASF